MGNHFMAWKTFCETFYALCVQRFGYTDGLANNMTTTSISSSGEVQV